MAVDIEHSALPDAELHEPKGVASATSGSVYTADGAGSGSWMSQLGGGVSVVTVSAASDFPAAVAGVITLAANTAYMLTGTIDVGSNRFVTNTSSAIVGPSAATAVLISSTTGVMFTSNDVTLIIYRVAVIGLTASKVFDFASSTSTHSLVMEQGVVLGDTIGTVAGVATFVFRHQGMSTATAAGLTFSGVCKQFKLADATVNISAGVAIDFGTSTWDSVFIGPNVQFDIASGATGVAVGASSANINATGRGHIVASTFFGAGTAITGYTSSDLLWDTVANKGIADTAHAAQGYITGNVTATTFPGGTGAVNAELVNFNAGVSSDILNQFTVSSAGRMTHIGKEDKVFFFDATLFGAIAGGASRQYIYAIAVNGVIVEGSISKAEYDGSNPGSNSVSSIVTLGENDYVELMVYAVTAATALTVDTASMKIRT